MNTPVHNGWSTASTWGLVKPGCLAGLLTLATGCAAPAADAALAEGQPADVQMSATVLKSGVSLFAEAIEKDELRGVVLLVARRGKIVLHEALGWRNLEAKQPMRPDTLFRMASNTKPVVATAILQLVEAGKLRLDDPVCHHFPAWDTDRSRPVQIRHLLTHTSGLRISPTFIRPLVERSDQYPDAPCLRAEADRFGQIGPEQPVGKSYSYNNPGYNTLGALVEFAGQKPLKDYLRERIYEPLGMKESWNHESDAPAERMARVYRWKEKDQVKQWTIQWSPGDKADWPFVRGSGGMIASARDYAVFCQMWLNGGVYGGQRILTEATVREATQPHSRAAYSETGAARVNRFYGYGWFVDQAGAFSHGGSDGTYAWIDPTNELIGLVLTQSPEGKNPREQFRKVVTAACYEGK